MRSGSLHDNDETQCQDSFFLTKKTSFTKLPPAYTRITTSVREEQNRQVQGKIFRGQNIFYTLILSRIHNRHEYFVDLPKKKKYENFFERSQFQDENTIFPSTSY